jgi:hypothetical protein
VCDELGQCVEADQVGLEQLAYALLRLRLGWFGVGDAGVVEQDVDPAEALDGGGDQRLAVGRRAHVTADGQRVLQRCSQLQRVLQRCSQFDVGVVPREARMTLAPAASSTRAKRWPRPDDVPVTAATRPSSCINVSTWTGMDKAARTGSVDSVMTTLCSRLGRTTR